VFAAVGYASVQAKVRARRSRSLDDATWRRLIEASSWDRTLDVLATTPYLAVAHDPVRIERALRQRVYRETIELADDVPRRGAELLRWYAGRFRVHDLKLWIRALHYGRPATEALDGTTLEVEDDPSVRAWTKARTVPELVAAVGDTLYGRALANAMERYQNENRPFYLEVALDLTFGRGLLARIEALGGSDAADAERLLGRWLARTNLLAAARYRLLAGIRPEQIVAFTLHKAYGGGLAAVQRIAAGGELAAEAPAVGLELPPELEGEAAIRAFERRADQVRREDAATRFGRGPFGLGLPLAYLIELEAEVDDLVTLLEAKLQGLPPEDLAERIPREVS
jgi:vacuolar-type H+-ATPase subunit C/Vma6